MFTGPVNGYFGMMAQRFTEKNDDPVRDLPNGVTDTLGSYGESGDLHMDRRSAELIRKSSIHIRKIYTLQISLVLILDLELIISQFCK